MHLTCDASFDDGYTCKNKVDNQCEFCKKYLCIDHLYLTCEICHQTFACHSCGYPVKNEYKRCLRHRGIEDLVENCEIGKDCLCKYINIYTWGNIRKDPRKDPRPYSMWNLNVCNIISYRKYGINLKRTTGLNKKLQDIMKRTDKFKKYKEKVMVAIKNKKIGQISFNCEHGKHRSVAFAELMKKHLESIGYTVELNHLNIR